MTRDRRLTPANGRVAAQHLQGLVEAARFTDGEPAGIAVPVADLWADPSRRARDRQLLMGEHVRVYDRSGGMAFVAAARDGYVGYVDEAALGPETDATHMVGVIASHLYPRPDIKALAGARLSFGARLQVIGASGAFFETAGGAFVPRAHLRPLARPMTDPASVAQLFFGVPYLWGGNSADGIDCSGLVQAAFLACGTACPGDSDLQETALGAPVPEGSALARGDLVFWQGHVAIAVDAEVLLHANAHHMAVGYEPAAAAIARIEAQGDGAPTSHRRVGAGISPPRG